MMTKNASVSYTLASGTVLPGYRGGMDILGMDLAKQAPGWGFVFGSQKDIRQELVNKDLLRKIFFNNAFANEKVKI